MGTTVNRDINSDIRRLEARIQVLEDREAILKTLYQYSYCHSHGLVKEWIDLFTEDAVFGVDRLDKHTRPPLPTFRKHGRAEIAKWAEQETHARVTTHHQIDKVVGLQPRIILKGDEATVESYLFHWNARVEGKDAGIPFIQDYGRYNDRLVRCPDGNWRFKERIAELQAAAAVSPYHYMQNPDGSYRKAQ